ncbi:hypothetical protein FIV34_00325 [Luteibacter pinisoli]|uniref:Secreted protein n=1 Tax=Luteibacter pinisoli TaxID=2589080 RepID=A0A4Y5YXP5_9GAMM|nr:hypothetical protein [Luteibacter pinisoli]QDE37750.1 hypothetical protein FIV34_00325 [Luteibacter pinisoli]
MHSKVSRIISAAVLLFLVPLVASATPPTGAWRGMVWTGKKQMILTVHFDGPKATLALGDPYNCRVTMAGLTDYGNRVAYRSEIGPGADGFCDTVRDAPFVARPLGTDELQIGLDTPGDHWQGQLQRMSPLSM